MEPKPPPRPVECHATARRQIIALLEAAPLSAKDLSQALGIPEKEVYPHLEHIQLTLRKGERNLIISPPACRQCGFEFTKRHRLKKPGRCPICRSETIKEPLFAIGRKR